MRRLMLFSLAGLALVACLAILDAVSLSRPASALETCGGTAYNLAVTSATRTTGICGSTATSGGGYVTPGGGGGETYTWTDLTSVISNSQGATWKMARGQTSGKQYFYVYATRDSSVFIYPNNCQTFLMPGADSVWGITSQCFTAIAPSSGTTTVVDCVIYQHVHTVVLDTAPPQEDDYVYFDNFKCLDAKYVSLLPCGHVSFSLDNGYLTHPGDSASGSDYLPCDYADPRYVPPESEQLVPTGATLMLSPKPDTLDVGGANRVNYVTADKDTTTCTYRKYVDGRLVVNSPGASCTLGDLTTRTKSVSYALTLTPSGSITKCTTKTQVGCHYFAGPTAKKLWQQAVPVSVYRASNPNETLTAKIQTPATWSYTWYSLDTPARTDTCHYSIVGYFNTRTPCVWEYGVASPTLNAHSGSLSITVKGSPRAMPLVGAVPVPVAGR